MENTIVKSIFENGVLKIANFEQLKHDVDIFVNADRFNADIYDDNDYKELKQARTELNKRQKEITDGRLKITRAFCGEFEKNCKEIESILKEKSNEIGEKLTAYKDKKEAENKVKIYTLTIKTADINLIAEIKNLCDKKNVVIEEGEE